METFGILNFLKPLLDFTQNLPNQNANPLSPTPPAQNTEKQENVTSSQSNFSENSSPATPDFSPSQQAFLNFYQAHENRAKRTRK